MKLQWENRKTKKKIPYIRHMPSNKLWKKIISKKKNKKKPKHTIETNEQEKKNRIDNEQFRYTYIHLIHLEPIFFFSIYTPQVIYQIYISVGHSAISYFFCCYLGYIINNRLREQNKTKQKINQKNSKSLCVCVCVCVLMIHRNRKKNSKWLSMMINY